MKKFLSLLLAVLMVVSLVPMLALSIGAEGEDNSDAFPELMITEIAVNTANYGAYIQRWVAQVPAFAGYAIPENAASYTDVFRYIEIYNAGTEAVDLYDYKLAFDADAHAAGTEIVYSDLAGTGEALLAPGECAVVWIRSAAETELGLTVEQFKGVYEWLYYSANTTYTYAINLSETPVIAVDVASGFDLATAGQVLYGIVEDSVVDTTDENRAETWVSWAYWYSHLGIAANMFTEVQVIAGVTDVTGGTTFIWDAKLLTYFMPSLENGAADENGKAVENVKYFTADLAKLSKNSIAPWFCASVETSSCHYLYGYDPAKPLCAGIPYSWSSTDQTPGILTNVQSAALPAPGVVTDMPELVISEVSPLPVNPAFEYVEVINISDKAVNVYDYSVVQSESYITMRTEYFSKVNTLIPGDYGNIYVASPNSQHYDYEIRNPQYDQGWLAPGETAVLWSCASTVPLNYYTMSDFYAAYDLEEDVKVFAYDSDPITGSVHTNLADAGYRIIGLAKNEKIGWTGDPYVSAPQMSAIQMTGGVATAINRGVSIKDCESFVLTNSLLMAGTTTMMADGYAYQFAWSKHEGVSNKLGTLAEVSQLMIAYESATSYKFADPVISDAWFSSPGTLMVAQMNEVTVPVKDARYVLYMQDYNKVQDVAMPALPEGFIHDSTFTVADGKLTVANGTAVTEKWEVLNPELLSGLAFTVEYKILDNDQYATVRVVVDEIGNTAVYIDDVLTTDAQDAYLEVTDQGVVMVVNAGITATFDSIVVYTETNLSDKATFYYLGNLENGEEVYLAASVIGNKDISDAAFAATEGSVTAVMGSETSMTFSASLSKDYIDGIKNYFDYDCAMLVFRADDLGLVSTYSPEALAAAGVEEGTYTFLQGADKISHRAVGKNYRITMKSEVTMADNYYRDAYTAVGIITVETALGTVTYTSDFSDAVTVTQVLASALQDTSDTRTAEYCYDLGDGTWARYTNEQLKAFAKICKQAI